MRTKKNKTLTGGYGLMVFGLITGIFGLHRFHLGKKISGVTLSILSIGSIFLIGWHYVRTTSQLLTSLIAMQNGQYTNDLDNTFNQLTMPSAFFYIGSVAALIATLLWVFDLFLLPTIVKNYNQIHSSLN